MDPVALEEQVKTSVFVIARLTMMEMHPGMWAFTREAFAMQLLVLAELWLNDTKGSESTRQLLPQLLGHQSVGLDLLTQQVDDEWARESIRKTKLFLKMKEGTTN